MSSPAAEARLRLWISSTLPIAEATITPLICADAQITCSRRWLCIGCFGVSLDQAITSQLLCTCDLVACPASRSFEVRFGKPCSSGGLMAGRLYRLGDYVVQQAICSSGIGGREATRSIMRSAIFVSDPDSMPVVFPPGQAAKPLVRCTRGQQPNYSLQLPGHSPVAFSKRRAPWRSITVLTTANIAPCIAVASSISLKGYSVSSALGGSSLALGAARFQICLKMVPAITPLARN